LGRCKIRGTACAVSSSPKNSFQNGHWRRGAVLPHARSFGRYLARHIESMLLLRRLDLAVVSTCANVAVCSDASFLTVISKGGEYRHNGSICNLLSI
jgi:aspartyl/asparaginyl beta-hydroxylase (cupin superfamily)